VIALAFCVSVAFSCIDCIAWLYSYHTFVTTSAEFFEFYACVLLTILPVVPSSHPLPSAGNCKEGNLEKDAIEEVDDDETKPQLMSVQVTFPAEQSAVKGSYLKAKLDKNCCFPKPPTTWDTGIIPIVPSDYRQSRLVIKVSGPRMYNIARNIFMSNKARSVYAVYDKATVKCKTSSYLKFTIRLLYLTTNMDIVLVDVRRVSGCAMAFRDEYQAVFQAVLPVESPSRQLHGGTMNLFAGFESMDIPDIPVEEDIIERSLEISMVNLKSKMYDTRIITLQDLLLTTGPESKELSSTACKLILGKYEKILEYVVNDIMKKVEITGFNEDDSEEYQRSLNLNILGNLLSSMNNYDTLDSLMQKSSWTVPLIDCLVWYVSMATNYPWNACLAAKCLRLLAPNVSMQKANVGMNSALENARRYGIASYDLLEKEANAALLVLDV